MDTLVVDKTGTLTEGKPRLVSVEPVSGQDPDALLAMAASLERGSEHPLAAAVVRAATERNLTLSDSAGFGSVTGKGVTGTVAGRKVAVGNRALMETLSLDPAVLSEKAESLRKDGQTVMFVAIDGKPAGLLGVTDPVKESAAEAVAMLKETGIRIVMVTGDNQLTAAASTMPRRWRRPRSASRWGPARTSRWKAPA